MDKVVIVDENDKETGLLSREIAHKDGTLHRISVVYLENNQGEILVQERMDGRLDHSSAGHVDPGETYLEAAKRELFEELGVVGDLKRLSKGYSEEVDSNNNRHIRHVFDVFSIKAQPKKLLEAEVKSVYWAKPKDILIDMEKNIKNYKYSTGFVASLPIYLGSLQE